MKKNVGGQVVGAQLNSKTDGTAVTTGATLVYVTGDHTTQHLGEGGSSPSGEAVHMGNGWWEFTPTQAETNYDHVAFTFVNSAAVIASLQIYPGFPQTGDSYARVGAPVGASVSADLAAVKAVLPAALVSGRMDSSVGAYQSGLTPLQPTTAGRTLDVSVDGEAGLDWANIGSPTTVVALSGTTIKSATDVVFQVADVQNRLPPALISGGRIDASVGAYQTGLTPLQPTSAGRTLDVSVGGEAGLDWANIGSPTTVVALSGTTVKTATDVATQATDIQGRLPAALVSGRIDASVGAMANDVVTAAAIAADAIGSSELASSAVTEIQTGLSTLDAAGVRTALGLASANLDTQLSGIQSDTDDIQTRIPAALVGGRMDASVGAMASNVVTAAAIATDAIDADAVAADAVTEIQSGLSTLNAAGVRTAVGLAAANLDTQLALVDADVLTRLATSGYTAPLSAAGTRTAVGLATANLDTQLSGIQADTDDIQTRLPAALVSGRMDSSVGAMANNVVTAAAIATDAIDADALAADAVAEIQSGLSTMNAAGVRSAIGLASADLDTQLSGIAAVTTKLDGMLETDTSGPYRFTSDALLEWSANYVEGTHRWDECARGWNSALLGKASGMATTTAVFRSLDDDRDRINATVDSDGNRTAVTLDLTP